MDEQELRIKEAFGKVKADIGSLRRELEILKQTVVELREQIKVGLVPNLSHTCPTETRLDNVLKDLATIKDNLRSPKRVPKESGTSSGLVPLGQVPQESHTSSTGTSPNKLPKTRKEYINYKIKQATKKTAKQRIMELAVKEEMPLPDIKFKLSTEMGLPKTSFYRYVEELMEEGNISADLSPASSFYKKKLKESRSRRFR